MSRRSEPMANFFDTQDGRIVHLGDIGQLEAGAERIRHDMEAMEPGQERGKRTAIARATG